MWASRKAGWPGSVKNNTRSRTEQGNRMYGCLCCITQQNHAPAVQRWLPPWRPVGECGGVRPPLKKLFNYKERRKTLRRKYGRRGSRASARPCYSPIHCAPAPVRLVLVGAERGLVSELVRVWFNLAWAVRVWPLVMTHPRVLLSIAQAGILQSSQAAHHGLVASQTTWLSLQFLLSWCVCVVTCPI